MATPAVNAPITAQDRILASSQQNSALLQTLSETDYASSALSQNSSHINNLQKDIFQQESTLATCRKITANEFVDHKKYRDSHVRRLGYKLSGKASDFSAKAEKEEKEYFEAIQNEFRAEKHLDLLKRQLAEALDTKAKLDAAAAQHQQAQKQLEELYARIFDGPTEGFPHEDRLEMPVMAAKARFDAASSQVAKQQQAVNALGDAHMCLKTLLGSLGQALHATQADMLGFGGFGYRAEMAESHALQMAQAQAGQVGMLMEQARRANPAIPQLPPIRIAQFDMITNLLFDNLFTDMDLRYRIDESSRQAYRANQALDAILAGENNKLRTLVQERDGAGRELETRRKELMEVRKQAFETVAGGLPAYQSEPPEYQP